MKFAFKLAIISSLLLMSPAQNGNYDFEVYEFDPMTGSLKPVTLRPSTMRPPTTRRYENNVFLQIDPNRMTTNALSMPSRTPMSTGGTDCNTLLTVHNDVNGAWAELMIPSREDRLQIYLKVLLKVASLLPSRYVGDISLVKDKQSTIADVANGQPILYRIRFPIQNPIPKLIAVYYNNQLICTGPSDVGEFVTTIQLDHTLYTGLSASQLKPVQPSYNSVAQPQPRPTQPPVYQTQPPVYQTQPPVYQTRPPAPRPQPQPQPTYTNSAERVGEFSAQCGVPNYRQPGTTGLVLNGRPGIKGQFPWYAAFHHNGLTSSGFICGGSLVSTKVVITAAHCVQEKQEANARRPEESLFYLGKYYLTSQPNEQGHIVSGVSQFFISNDWNPFSQSYDGDIAAAILVRTIQFTNFIRPICIWTSTNSYNDIINHNGVVVGYGKSDVNSQAASDKPLWVDLPVVDEGTCLRSNNAFSRITSHRTFCVGKNDGSGPCNGDSGGPFAVKNNGKWYLRGVVSSSLVNLETLICDTQNFAVFTDVAAYTDWIVNFVNQYG